MLGNIFSSYEATFVFNVILSLIAGMLIGAERESRGKAAGISTHTLVILGSMLFTFISPLVDSESTSRIAAQIITGIGFLGAGIILREARGKIMNLTTAASIWCAAGIGMAIGFQFYTIAMITTVLCAFIPRIPRLKHDGRPRSRR